MGGEVLQKNILMGIIVILLITNGLTLTVWKSNEKQVSSNNSVVNQDAAAAVAVVGDKKITYQELIAELEANYGKDMLKELVNREVIRQMAEEKNISISSEQVDRELTLLKTVYQEGVDSSTFMNEDKWREEIKYLMLLEELLTQDVVISTQELKEFYRENEDMYHVPTTYHLYHIVVSTEAEANDVLEELNNGSNFSVLAMERSNDVFSASQGGDLGYISSNSGYVPEKYIEVVKGIEEGEWSLPIQTEEGYAIVYVKEIIENRTYTFEDVKDQIRRQLAMQQIGGTYSAEPFWSEVGVDWKYEK